MGREGGALVWAVRVPSPTTVQDLRSEGCHARGEADGGLTDSESPGPQSKGPDTSFFECEEWAEVAERGVQLPTLAVR